MSALLFLSSLLLLSCLLLSPVTADVPADLIDTIPGYGKPPSKHYSGFLPVDDAKTVFLHYWLVLSTGNPTTDPLAVWMNGGPGCSSLEGGLYELGPFTFTGDRDSTGLPTLQLNPSAWTTVSSVLFLEQPAGVGFSYATNGTVQSDDFIQSQNTYGFMLNFFKAYPELSKNDFYITGESYAGIYVPTLAYRVLEGNRAGMPYINIKGIAVGNGCWGDEVGTCSGAPDSQRIALTLYHGHGMISEAIWESLIAECGVAFNISTSKCGDLIGQANDEVGQIDVYNVYAAHTHHTLSRAALANPWTGCADAPRAAALCLCVAGTTCATTAWRPRPRLVCITRCCARPPVTGCSVCSRWATASTA